MPRSQADELLDHEYDGIREYDNPTPGWWHLIFIGSVVFAVVHFAFFEFSPLSWTPESKHEQAQLRQIKKQFGELGTLEPTAETIYQRMSDQKWMEYAASVFQTNCISCHGAKGEGLIGPNLTDDAYKNVANLTDIAKVINEGAANGAMPAWENRLHPNQVVLLSSYVARMRGTNVTGRGPEGQEIEPWTQP